MVTGFEIFGVIGTSIALLNLARQGYESLAKTYGDYKKAGPHMVELQRHCSNIYFIIQGWTRLRGFDVPMTDELYKAYWGEDGWKQIESQLAAVSIKCADLAAIIDRALPPTETYDQIPEEDRERARARLNQRAASTRRNDPPIPRPLRKLRQAIYPRISKRDTEKKVEEIHVLEEHITRATSTWKKAKYVLSSSENLQKHLKALEEDFRELTQLVKMAWQLQHPRVNYNTSTLNERHLAALTNARQSILQEAKEDRQATKVLYGCCSGTQQAVKLELGLLDTTGDSRSKRFHIFVPQVQYNECLEISTVILRTDPPLGDVDWRDNFHDACEKVRQKEKGLLWMSSDNQNDSTGSLRGIRGKLWFSLSKRASHVGLLDLSRLSVQLVSLAAAERLELAYSVVETGLILFGTSWLSAISSMALKRFKAKQKPPRYVLDINERYNLIRTRLEDQRSLHLYIFTIGITLVEIALQAMILDLRQSESGLEFLIRGSEGVKWRSPSHVASLVRAEFGTAYSEAVEFCLQDPVLASNRLWKGGVLYDTTRSQEQISMELLDLFYSNVLIKLVP